MSAPAPHGAAEWTGLFLAPATFFAHLQLAYVLVTRACRYHDTTALHAAGVASVALAALGTLAAWRARRTFLGAVGLGVSALLTLLLAAQWATVFVLSPCQ